MKIGILTFHRSVNYGAFLQAYALQHSLERDIPGAQVEIIDYECASAKKYMRKRILVSGFPFGFFYYLRETRLFRTSMKYLNLSPIYLITDDIHQFGETYKNQYDLIVVGSDQVWVTDGFRGFPNAYWLPEDMGSIKVSYAASSRSEMSKLNENDQRKLSDYIRDFKYIGVRDECTQREIEKVSFREDIHINCDPVFTWDFGDLRKAGKKILAEKFHVPAEKKTIGIMMAESDNSRNIVSSLAGKGFEIVAFHYKQKGAHNAVTDPFEWIACIAALDGFITSFFHGTCFAMKYNIPFVSIETKKTGKERSKLYDLLKRTDLLDRYLTDRKEYIKGIDEKVINVTSVSFDTRIRKLRELYTDAVRYYIRLANEAEQ